MAECIKEFRENYEKNRLCVFCEKTELAKEAGENGIHVPRNKNVIDRGVVVNG